jgi:hypothetical protein
MCDCGRRVVLLIHHVRLLLLELFAHFSRNLSYLVPQSLSPVYCNHCDKSEGHHIITPLYTTTKRHRKHSRQSKQSTNDRTLALHTPSATTPLLPVQRNAHRQTGDINHPPSTTHLFTQHPCHPAAHQPTSLLQAATTTTTSSSLLLPPLKPDRDLRPPQQTPNRQSIPRHLNRLL